MRTAEAVSLETGDRKVKNTINISNCLDIEKGTVTVSVENPDADDQVINIDIDGEVYTTGARTKVWGGDVDGGEYYADAVAWAQENSTRAETAAVFQRIAENLK